MSWVKRATLRLRTLVPHVYNHLSYAQSSYADPTYPSPSDTSLLVSDLFFNKLPSTIAPKIFPYGDNWELLWVGHCGMPFPFKSYKTILKSA